MSKAVKKDKDAANLYHHLNDAFEKLQSVAFPLPGHSCKSKAVSSFRGRSKATKDMFKAYRELFGKDNEVFKATLEKIEEIDIAQSTSISASAGRVVERAVCNSEGSSSYTNGASYSGGGRGAGGFSDGGCGVR